MTGATGVERRNVVAVLGITNLDVAKSREQPAITGVAGGHHAIEHVDALCDP